jgi:hypothetical protein
MLFHPGIKGGRDESIVNGNVQDSLGSVRWNGYP